MAAAYEIDTLRGDEAQDFVEELSRVNARFLEAQARSAARLRMRGYHPTDIVVVQRVYLLRTRELRASNLGQQLLQLVVPALLAQDTYYTDEGTAVVTSWDDGDNATWEGNMFLMDGTQDLTTSVDSQLDITQDQPPPVYWAQGDMWGDDGSGEDKGPYPVRSDDARDILKFGSTALRVTRSDVGDRALDPPGRYLLVRQNACLCGTTILARCLLRAGWDNGWSWCAGGVVGCLLTGPAYPGCLGSTCATAILAYTFVEARGYWNRCVRQPV